VSPTHCFWRCSSRCSTSFPWSTSNIAGVVVSLVALTKGLPVRLATAPFYIVYRFLEDYLVNPRVMKHTVKVTPGLTITATLIGGTLLGRGRPRRHFRSPPPSTFFSRRWQSPDRTSGDDGSTGALSVVAEDLPEPLSVRRAPT
jgi:hypothetical protein